MHHEHWSDALFLHYEADPKALQKLLPSGLIVDTFEKKAYVGVVALSEIGITPTFLPRWLRKLLSLSHFAVNVRTYVRSTCFSDEHSDFRRGIYFFTLDCSHCLPALGARILFNLPYRLATMVRRIWKDCGRRNGQQQFMFQSQRRWNSSASLNVEWEIVEQESSIQQEPNALSNFFVERYSLFHTTGTFLRMLGVSRGLWYGSITHDAWPLKHVRVTRLSNTLFSTIPGLEGAIINSKTAPIVHYSPGVSDIRFYFHDDAKGTSSAADKLQ